MAALSLQLRAKGRILQNRTFIRLFSSSSNSSSDGGGDNKESQSPPSPSPFSEVRASLRQSPPATPRRLLQTPPPLDSIPSNATKSSSFDEIRKNFLSQYSAKTAPPQTPPHPTSFKELYDRNVVRKGGGGGGGVASFESIKNSLKLIRESKPEQNRGGVDPLSLQVFKESLQMKPHANIPGRSSPVLFGSSQTPLPRKDLKGTKSEGSKNYLLRAYKYEELGERLRKLRPTDANMGKNWFSLSELNQRLQKLRDIEEKESASSIGGVTFADLRNSLSSLQHDADEKTKKSSRQKLDILGHLGGTPSYMLSPPKEQLVEKFFHPDNMSSAEKLKLELIKARDEFKVSESDCGSSRVQVAQLTIKIKHLSSVLHKKDKHSRKGLQEMVQKRKKHLRYLRRTDWDSYCFCLSKLGLRDNPDYKN